MNCSVTASIVIFSILSLFCGDVLTVELGTSGSQGSQGNNSSLIPSTIENVIISLSILCTLVLMVFGCTWAWWKRVLCFWKNKGTHEAPPDWFEPQRSSNGGPTNFSTLDAANLSRDTNGRDGRTSITIDPLPSLHDLGLNGRDSFELKNLRPPSIVSVSSTPTGELLDVQDWFKEPQINFPRVNLEYQQIIGKGWFGKVLQAEAINIRQYIRNSNVVARELRSNATEQDQMRFLDEARMYRDACEQRCEYILKLLGHCVEIMPYILIFEYYPLGDLKSYLKLRGKQAPAELKVGDDGVLTRMVIDIIRGVKWMEQAGFVHGDLSARNCLVATSAGRVVIGDYGFSTQKFRSDYFWCSSTGSAIPIRWAAPETLTIEEKNVVNGNEGETGVVAQASPSFTHIKSLEITHVSNIWTLGVVIWEIFQLGKTPYENLTDEDVIRRVIKQKSFILEPPQLPFLKNATKDKIYQMLVSCWNSTPSHRPSIDAIEELFTTPI